MKMLSLFALHLLLLPALVQATSLQEVCGSVQKVMQSEDGQAGAAQVSEVQGNFIGDGVESRLCRFDDPTPLLNVVDEQRFERRYQALLKEGWREEAKLFSYRLIANGTQECALALIDNESARDQNSAVLKAGSYRSVTVQCRDLAPVASSH